MNGVAEEVSKEGSVQARDGGAPPSPPPPPHTPESRGFYLLAEQAHPVKPLHSHANVRANAPVHIFLERQLKTLQLMHCLSWVACHIFVRRKCAGAFQMISGELLKKKQNQKRCGWVVGGGIGMKGERQGKDLEIKWNRYTGRMNGGVSAVLQQN